MQMSQRCAEVAPGIRPSVEGDDGADWCVVDAGTPLHVDFANCCIWYSYSCSTMSNLLIMSLSNNGHAYL